MVNTPGTPAVPANPGLKTLFASPKFAGYATTKFVSSLGTWAYRTAIIFLSAEVSPNPTVFAIVAATLLLPSVLMPVAGRLSDTFTHSGRISRRGWVTITQTLFLIESLLLSLLVWQDWVSPLWLMILGAFGGVVYAMNQPVEQVLFVDYAPPGYEVAALTASGVWHRSAQVLGAVLAGLTIQWAGYLPIFAFNTVSYIAVIVFLLCVHPFTPGSPPHGTARGTAMSPLRKVIHDYMVKDKLLRTNYLLGFVYAAGLGNFYALAVIPLNVMSNSNPSMYGALGGAIAVGGLAVSNRVSKQRALTRQFATVLVVGGVLELAFVTAGAVGVGQGWFARFPALLWVVLIVAGLGVGASTLAASSWGNSFIIVHSPPELKTQLLGLYLGVFYVVGGVFVFVVGVIASVTAWYTILGIPAVVAVCGGLALRRWGSDVPNKNSLDC